VSTWARGELPQTAPQGKLSLVLLCDIRKEGIHLHPAFSDSGERDGVKTQRSVGPLPWI
jgi:hypothetical protein